MRKNTNKIIAGVIMAIVLAFLFWYGGDAPGFHGWIPEPKDSVNIETEDVTLKTELPEVTDNLVFKESEQEKTKESGQKVSDISVKQEAETATEENKPQNADKTSMTPAEKEALAERIAEKNNVLGLQNANNKYFEENEMLTNEAAGEEQYKTEAVFGGNPLPVEPQDAVISDKELSCTLSVRCDTILKKIAWLDKEKVDIVPEDGVIFEEKTVTFYEGESVFNLLLREMKQNNIHLEFKNTPIYNSAYIQGIANIYEFDCGELSGWMYKVNDWFPNYGCSHYQLKAGDKVEWVYTCDLGIDVGGYYTAKGE